MAARQIGKDHHLDWQMKGAAMARRLTGKRQVATVRQLSPTTIRLDRGTRDGKTAVNRSLAGSLTHPLQKQPAITQPFENVD